jgi:hypothetical protein
MPPPSKPAPAPGRSSLWRREENASRYGFVTTAFSQVNRLGPLAKWPRRLVRVLNPDGHPVRLAERPKPRIFRATNSLAMATNAKMQVNRTGFHPRAAAKRFVQGYSPPAPTKLRTYAQML